MDRSSAQLKLECLERGIELDLAKKYSRQDMINLLAQHTLKSIEKPTWGLLERLKIQSPMLCFSFKHLDAADKAHVMSSDRWIAETKYDGCRLMAFYHPDEGFTFFSRNVSVETYLPVEYTDTVLLIKDGKVSKPSDWKGQFKKSFILDGEVLCKAKNIDTTLFSKNGVVTGSELNAVSAILAINVEDSHTIQTSQAPLNFVYFDILQFDGKPVCELKLEQRKTMLKQITERLSGAGLPFEESKYVTGAEKEQFYQDTVTAGGEGLVLKNLDKKYIATTSRPRDVQIKRKRSVAESAGGDIDTFVTGFIVSDKDKAWSHLIGGFKLSVHLTKADGTEVEHWIGSVGSMPLELREKASEIGPDGKPCLKKEYYGKVLAINGQDISAKNFRFMHCSTDWAVGFRTDKTEHDCLLDESFLRSQVL